MAKYTKAPFLWLKILLHKFSLAKCFIFFSFFQIHLFVMIRRKNFQGNVVDVERYTWPCQWLNILWGVLWF